MPETKSSGAAPATQADPKQSQQTATQQQHQQHQQHQQRHSPSPSPRPHHSQPVPMQGTSHHRQSHSPHAPRSPSLAYHHPSSLSSSPVRLPRPQNTAELHQELEREQEGVVNRLLHMIRSASQTSLPPASPPASATSHPPGPIRQSSTGGASEDGRRHSRQNSDASDLWMMGGGLGGRDEATFYRTEAEMLSRENEMLRRRIRELEEMAKAKDSADKKSVVGNKA